MSDLPAAPSFIHLSVHSEFSLVDSVVRVKPLVKELSAQGAPAVALTDHCNLFALVKFYAAAQGAGIKPIVGCDLRVQFPDVTETTSLTLLCINDAGYKNLARLISRAYQEGQTLGEPQIEAEWLTGATDGLIALSGAQLGELGKLAAGGKPELLEPAIARYQQWFPQRFYLEVQRCDRPGEEEWITHAVQLATQHQLPLVATNPVRFLKSESFDAHEARVCIRQSRTLDDPRRPRDYSDQQYLRSPAEMAELFDDLPSALQNTVEIAKRCSVELKLGTYYLPDFPLPDGVTIDDFLRAESHKGLEGRLDQLFGEKKEEQRQEYVERLDFELDVIIQMGFPGYFLIVADFIKWAKENDIPVGPGRGSGAGSLVAYALLITDLDPLEYDLLFERFLNPERVSMPDFDVDFCMDKRDQVIDYVARKYGREKVSQIITYGTMAAKAVIRDAGRVLAHPFGFVDRVAKLIPPDLGMTLTQALEDSEELKALYDSDEEVTGLMDLALSLEGIARNAGKHAGGVVISPTPLTDFTALYCESDGGSVVTQFDKDDVEKVGLVKFDFLGLRTLTIIDWAVKDINKRLVAEGNESLVLEKIPLTDKPTFDLLKAAQTTAVFQLESRGMKELIKKLLPDSFEDIIALVALFRPGPLQSGMVDDFINRKHGREKVSYPHPDYDMPQLEPVLKPTYGIILYQEQVMQIGQVLSGYTLGGADMLRRAMGKKKPEEMAKQREIFTTGASEQGVEEETSNQIFDLVEKFAGYGFNKSHSAAYALLSYQTAWLKCHYPSEFMAAVLSADMDNTEKVVGLIDECREMKLKVVPPDINRSLRMFSVGESLEVVYGLGAIKGVGANAIEEIILSRETDGPYRDLLDFCQRMDLRKANKRVLEALIRGGAMDSLGLTRATLMAQLRDCISAADQTNKAKESGQNDMFGAFDEPENNDATLDLAVVPEWPELERLKQEKSSLGLYLTGHPINSYKEELSQFTFGTLKRQLEAGDTKHGRKEVLIAGLLIDVRVRDGKRATLMLDDNTGRMEVNLFSESYEANRDKLKVDEVLVIRGNMRWSDFAGANTVSATEVLTMGEARTQFARRLMIRCKAGEGEAAKLNGELPMTLRGQLEPFTGEGGCPVFIDYQNGNAKARLELGREWTVRPEEGLVAELRQLLGKAAVKVVY